MQFTGRNLEHLFSAVDRAISDVHTEQGHLDMSVPGYEAYIDELEEELEELEDLRARMERALEREERRRPRHLQQL